MRNKKGFTLVELVIVIAVIAILAGVMIGTFASVVKKAQKSVEQQEMAAAKTEQTANDILEKLNNKDWLGWTDFETSLAEKIGEQTQTIGNANVAVITDALQKAVDEFAKKASEGNTGLTEAQVRYIIEDALSKNGTGVTEAQVKAIVNSAVSSIGTPVTKAQIQAIVDAAQAKNLTMSDIVQAIKDAGLYTTEEATKQADKILAAIESMKATALTEKQIEAIVEKLVPVTKTVNTAEEFEAAVKSLNSGSTIVVDGEDLELELTTTDVKTLIIKSEKTIKKLTVNAPNATVYVYCDAETLDVEAAALESVHLFGKVGSATICKGRVVFEAKSEVTGTVTVKSTGTVEIEIAAGVKVNAITVAEESTVNVTIANNGTIALLTNNSTKASVILEKGNGKIKSSTGTGTIVGEDGWTTITTAEGLKEALTNSGAGGNYKLEADINVDLSTDDVGVWKISNGKNVTIDMNGHDITVIKAKSITNKNEDAFIWLIFGKLEFTGKGTVTVDKSVLKDETLKLTDFWTLYVTGLDTETIAGLKQNGRMTDNISAKLIVGKDVTVEGTKAVEINHDGDGLYGINVEINGTLIGKSNYENKSGVGVHVTAGFSANLDEKTAPQITLGSTSVIKSWGTGIRPSGYAVWYLSGTITRADPESAADEESIFSPIVASSGTFYITGGVYNSQNVHPNAVAAGPYEAEKVTGAAITLSSDMNDFDGKYDDGTANNNEVTSTKLDVHISGGTFISDSNYALIECIAKNLKDHKATLTGYEAKDLNDKTIWEDSSTTDYVTLEITGGTFKGKKGAFSISKADCKLDTKNYRFNALTNTVEAK